MYSQNDEEAVILRFFGSITGRFLDIGAYDGKTFSNTFRLAEMGWSGLCFEPSPSVFPKLREIHGNNPLIHLVQSAVSDHTGTQLFYDSLGDAISSFDVEHILKWEVESGSKFAEVQVETITVAHLFERYGYDFDFINLDVEGCNWNIFSGIDFERLPRLKLICVEHDNRIEAMLHVLDPFGFKEIARNAENLIAGRLPGGSFHT
jgi:FkbM family methyltransferase